ncbi:hypothetical protein D3C72_1750530 [compost metagenome]
MRRGYCLRRLSGSSPSLASFCGRMLCMKTSAPCKSACSAACASGFFRSSTTLFLLRLEPMNIAAMPGSTAGPV